VVPYPQRLARRQHEHFSPGIYGGIWRLTGARVVGGDCLSSSRWMGERSPKMEGRGEGVLVVWSVSAPKCVVSFGGSRRFGCSMPVVSTVGIPSIVRSLLLPVVVVFCPFNLLVFLVFSLHVCDGCTFFVQSGFRAFFLSFVTITHARGGV